MFDPHPHTIPDMAHKSNLLRPDVGVQANDECIAVDADADRLITVTRRNHKRLARRTRSRLSIALNRDGKNVVFESRFHVTPFLKEYAN